MPVKEKLSFKSENERLQALSEIEDSPPNSVKTEEQVNNWIKEQEELQNRVIEADIVPESEEVTPEPQVQEEVEPQVQPEPEPEPEPQVQEQEEPQVQPEISVEEPPPPQEDGVFQFSLKREELPDSLKGYKTPEEIIRQADHARTYANKAEIKMKEMAAELEALKRKKAETPEVSKAPEVSQPVIPEATEGDLVSHLQEIQAMEDTDYVDAAKVKNVFSLAAKEIAATKKEIALLKADLGGKLTAIEKTNTENTQKDQVARQKEAVVKGIKELQNEHPELQTAKPVSYIMGQSDCVERDVEKFADQVLFSKWGNEKPTWQHRNAVINAYLGGNPEITAYCKQNAITPESVGSTFDDIKKYAMIMNIDANMRGEEIDKITGERKQKVSPFNGNPVNFNSYTASYRDLKDTTGITKEEQQKKLAEAEIRGQQSLTEAMGVRADTPKTLSDKGTMAPKPVKDMDVQAAWELINAGSDEFEMEQRALLGDRSLFHRYNKALRTVGFPEEKPSEHWPIEKTV